MFNPGSYTNTQPDPSTEPDKVKQVRKVFRAYVESLRGRRIGTFAAATWDNIHLVDTKDIRVFTGNLPDYIQARDERASARKHIKELGK